MDKSCSVGERLFRPECTAGEGTGRADDDDDDEKRVKAGGRGCTTLIFSPSDRATRQSHVGRHANGPRCAACCAHCAATIAARLASLALCEWGATYVGSSGHPPGPTPSLRRTAARTSKSSSRLQHASASQSNSCNSSSDSSCTWSVVEEV